MPPSLTIHDSVVFSRAELAALLDGGGLHEFRQCDFSGEDLSRLNLQGCRFHACQLAETSLYAAKLGDSHWRQCRGREADFESAELVDASFISCDLNNSRWRRAKLASCTFDMCKLTGASFEEVAHLGLVFKSTLLAGADVRGLSFRKAHLLELDFSGADLSGCDFRDAVFEGGSLGDIQMRQTRFEGADLRGANLAGLKLVDVKPFRGALISPRQAADLLGGLGLVVA